jgi:hypothetical protein
MRTLNEKEVTVLTLLAANSDFKDRAFEFLKGHPEALAIARVLLGENCDDPDVSEAAETIRQWAGQQRRSAVPA